MKRQNLSFVVALFAVLLVCVPDGLAKGKGKKPPKHDNPGQCGNDDGNGGEGGKGGKGEHGDHHNKHEVQVSLVRPDPAPDADATGTLKLRSHNDSERFQVRVENVDVTLAHDLFIEDPLDSGAFTLVGALVAKCDKLKLSLDTKHGELLPLGVAKVADLAGRDVEVRSGGLAVLTGTVPAFPECHKPLKAKAEITAPAGAPAPDMHAKLSLRSKADKGQERIELKAKNVPWAAGPFHVFIEDPAASALFQDVGELVQKCNDTGRYSRDTKHGDTLPLGVASVLDLAGRTLEVRDALGVVYLSGVIPTVE